MNIFLKAVKYGGLAIPVLSLILAACPGGGDPPVGGVDKTALNFAIREAEEALHSGIQTSADGTGSAFLPGVFWVTQAVWDALANALDAAEAVMGDSAAAQAQVNNALAALNTALADFIPLPGTNTGKEVTVTVFFTGPADETITLSGGSPSSWTAGGSITVTAAEDFDSYAWFLNGTVLTGEDGKSVTLNVRDYRLGSHRLTLSVTKGAALYSKVLNFSITE